MSTNFQPKNLSRWKRPQDYIGASWPEYFVFLSQHRDSSALDRSNFKSALKALGDETETVLVVSENHWAVGWVEWIAIHESDESALREADAIAGALEDYPVMSEEDFSQEEQDEADETWLHCYRPSERIAYIRQHRRQFEFHNFADMLSCVRGNYFAGYASELIH